MIPKQTPAHDCDRLRGQVVEVVAREPHALNGLMIFAPSMSAPSGMSSESSRVTPSTPPSLKPSTSSPKGLWYWLGELQ